MTAAVPVWIEPAWSAPRRVRACFTTRLGGYSAPPWNGLNLATHVGDRPRDVTRNRAALRTALSLPGEPAWLDQRHGHGVVCLDDARAGKVGDAAFARTRGKVCAVLVADCVPVLLCDRRGRQVAAVHAGWRGLAGGVIASAIAPLAGAPRDLLAWIGPAIGPAAYATGPEVRARFVAADAGAAVAFERRGSQWHMDLQALAARKLAALGVRHIETARECVHAMEDRYFSYRRDRVTGRMAALIWIE